MFHSLYIHDNSTSTIEVPNALRRDIFWLCTFKQHSEGLQAITTSGAQKLEFDKTTRISDLMPCQECNG